MKTKIILLMIIIFLCSCESRKVDKSFETDFNYAIRTIANHERMRGTTYDVWVARFYFAASYLEELTGISGNYTTIEHIPYYNTNYDLLLDIKSWKRWYNENKYNITKEHSDSIKSLVSSSYLMR